MMQQGRWIDRLMEGLELSEEVSVDSIVELAGDHRVLIEHHRGIQRYGQDCICVKVKFGTVVISGCSMEIARMTKDQLIITGNIHSVTLQRRTSI